MSAPGDERDTLPPPAALDLAPAVAETRGLYVEQSAELAWDDAFRAYERAGRVAAIVAQAHHLEAAYDAGSREVTDLRTAVIAMQQIMRSVQSELVDLRAHVAEQDRLISVLQDELRAARGGQHAVT